MSEAYQVDRCAVLKIEKGRSKKNMARKVAMYLVREKGGLRLNEITEVFGWRHYGGVSNAIHIVTKEMVLDKRLKKTVNTIINRLAP